MGGFSEQDFGQVNGCIEIAFKVEAQKLNMVQSAQLAIELDKLRGKLKAMIEKEAKTDGGK
jgi:hypothetical protein